MQFAAQAHAVVSNGAQRLQAAGREVTVGEARAYRAGDLDPAVAVRAGDLVVSVAADDVELARAVATAVAEAAGSDAGDADADGSKNGTCVPVNVDGVEVIVVLPYPESPTAAPASFPEVSGTAPSGAGASLSVLSDVPMEVTAVLGVTQMRIRDLLAIRSGNVLQLDRLAGAPVDILVNGTPFGRGDVVVVDDRLGVRLTELFEQPPAAS